MRPNNKGSVGKKSPRLSVYSSILTDKGVKNAIDKKNVYNKKMAK